MIAEGAKCGITPPALTEKWSGIFAALTTLLRVSPLCISVCSLKSAVVSISESTQEETLMREDLMPVNCE